MGAAKIRKMNANKDHHNKAVIGLTIEDLRKLKSPVSKERLRIKAIWNKDRSATMLIPYLHHAEVQNKLEEVDPQWSNEILLEEKLENIYYVRLRVTLKGVSRENIGEGIDPKSAISDALKRCAMLFGVGRFLNHLQPVWVIDSKSRSLSWSIEDYERIRKENIQENITSSQKLNSVAGLTSREANVEKRILNRDQLYRTLMNLYRPYLEKYSDTKFIDLLMKRYHVRETRFMSVEQLEDLVLFMKNRLSVAI